ncbi:radial spoke head protein 9 homolog isoform X4 [Ictalurus furcatus]|uniref:radial spoke head protein 9 homolog isoform X4 n=1 Tax=Ictalurus furcatus TaxID=66913 RepID=UPI002350C8FA|nr:radial spoke head protein 9 homolog isoform X4 [Ictalurus furcatus]
MDSSTLMYSLDLVCGNGLTLSTEQKAALHTSLLILKRNYKFNRVLFWGKILGIKKDYFIAQGVGEDEMRDRKCLYSFNCMDWHLLPLATEALTAEVAVAARGRFMGEPSHEYQRTVIRHQGEGDDAVEEEVMVKVSEEKRLAVTVFTINNEDAAVCLNPTEAGKLNNYLHFSEPKNLKKKSILELADLNPSIDFLDPLIDDIPKAEIKIHQTRLRFSSLHLYSFGKLYRLLCVKIPGDQQLRKYSNHPFGTNKHATIKIIEITFFPYSASPYLHDFTHCTAATRLADYIIAQMSRCTGVPNKLFCE